MNKYSKSIVFGELLVKVIARERAGKRFLSISVSLKPESPLIPSAQVSVSAYNKEGKKCEVRTLDNFEHLLTIGNPPSVAGRTFGLKDKIEDVFEVELVVYGETRRLRLSEIDPDAKRSAIPSSVHAQLRRRRLKK